MVNIKIYSTPTCPHCITAKEFLKENNIEYENFDVSQDKKAFEEMVGKSGQQGVPVLDIDGKIVIGFDEDKIKEILKIK